MRHDPQSVRNRLGRRVRSLRLSRGFSQERLAELAGSSTKQIGRIERGEGNATIDHLAAIAGGLGVGIADLFDAAARLPAPSMTAADLDRIDAALRIVERLRSGWPRTRRQGSR
jgi:transcriptional regulator with XRE-family HTH domain